MFHRPWTVTCNVETVPGAKIKPGPEPGILTFRPVTRTKHGSAPIPDSKSIYSVTTNGFDFYHFQVKW